MEREHSKSHDNVHSRVVADERDLISPDIEAQLRSLAELLLDVYLLRRAEPRDNSEP